MNKSSFVPKVANSYDFDYDEPEHRLLPHVVKFSGGRSSAMMLLILLHNRQLRPKRGDVIVFNNTSAEHPETYKFVRRCKEIAERRYGIPFFLTEFQTYEDAWLGRWRRVASYRLVKPTPYRAYKNRQSFGYRQKGEVFKEFISWNSQLPTRFARTCTEYLKLQTTAHFLEDWFGRCKPLQNQKDGQSTSGHRTRRLGHFYPESMMPQPETYGQRAEIVRYHFEQPCVRNAQKLADFSDAPLVDFHRKHIEPYVFDQKATLRSEDSLKFVSLVGLRADEPVRVARILERNNTAHSADRLADGEYVYAPLFNWNVGKQEVHDFWRDQAFDLEIPIDSNLSNCVYCFMKGPTTLRKLAKHSTGNGPSNIKWWAEIESDYARVVQSSKKADEMTTFGFFGANALTYERIIATSSAIDDTPSLPALPCECTD